MKITLLNKQMLLVCLFSFIGFSSMGQVTLTTSPYTENFNTTPGASGTTYPSGWTSYNGTSIDNAMVVGSSTSNSGANYNYNSRIGLLGSGSSFEPSSIVFSVANTTNKFNLSISYDVIKIREQGRSNTFDLEVSTTSATSGFTPITGASYISGSIAENVVTNFTNINLSSYSNISGTVWFRWSYTALGGSGSRDGVALDNVNLSWTSASVPSISYNDDNIFSGFGFQDVLTYSTSKSFLVSGTNLTNNIIATSPSINFELSLNNSTWSSAVSISPSANTVTNVPVYVRFYPQSAGTKTANISLTTTGGSDDYVSVVGTGVVPQLGTPNATAATTITGTSFVANWNSVSGATNYAIDVSTSPTFTDSNGFTTDLIISEYVEGSSNNKYIEIFNGTGSDVDLSDYELQLFSNGAASASNSNSLTGTLVSNSTVVYKNSSANIYSGTATDATAVGFNGDDAVALYKVSTSTYVDIFGEIGNDPGTSWNEGSNSTSNESLVRNSNVFMGVTSNPTGFPTLASQWSSYPEDTVSNLGHHAFDGGLTPSFVAGYNNLSVGNVTSYTITGLTQGTTYYYRVRAVGANTSQNSNVISLTTDITSVTWNGSAWSNTSGPTSTLEAVIEGAYTTATSELLEAKKITINSGSLTISANSTVEIQDELINNLTAAAVVVENNGILKQFNNTSNIGDITVKRNSTPIIRLDYTAWASPVAGQNALAFSPATVVNRFYDYSPTSDVYTAITPSSTDFTPGKGLLVRAPNNWSASSASIYPGVFKGVPSNGDISFAVSSGFNLLGNPYPSPIDADDLMLNSNNSALSMSALYFWTHAVPQDGMYVAGSNYSVFNSLGGTPSVSGGQTPDGKIQVGQGFLAQFASAGSVQFDNSMRLSASDGQFFRTNNSFVVEKHRMWFSLTSETKNYNVILLGYIQGATNGLDSAYDAELTTPTNSSIYTVINNSKYVIQGRALPFVNSDVVSLGLFAETAGQYTISISDFDGLFLTQDIYLRDNLLNITHDIKNSAYTFVTDAGQFDSRFDVVYVVPLSVDSKTFTSDSVVVYTDETNIYIDAGKTIIDNVKIYDVRGRLLKSKFNVNESSISIENISTEDQVFIIQISSLDNGTVTKKVVN